jgi:hypothetical protein
LTAALTSSSVPYASNTKARIPSDMFRSFSKDHRATDINRLIRLIATRPPAGRRRAWTRKRTVHRACARIPARTLKTLLQIESVFEPIRATHALRVLVQFNPYVPPSPVSA